MRRRTIAYLVFQCLRDRPDPEALSRFFRIRNSQVKKTLLYLDKSGLSLYLLDRFRTLGIEGSLSPDLKQALEERERRNLFRSEDMFSELSRVTRALDSSGAVYTVSKGFSLVPDYARAIGLRHQQDLDIFIRPDSYRSACVALRELGYEYVSYDGWGETKFVRYLGRPFYGMKDIYALQSASYVELHQHLWERRSRVKLNINFDPWSLRQTKTLHGLNFSAMSDEHIFVWQLLHCFRHLLSGWIRPSWLYEIAVYIASKSPHDALWEAVSALKLSGKTADACGLMLLLCRHLFQTELPPELEHSLIGPLPRSLARWVEEAGLRWAGSDATGSKLHLLIQHHFVENATDWRKQHSALLFPRRAPSARQFPRGQGESRPRWYARKLSLLVHRAGFHALSDLEYLMFSVKLKHVSLS